MTLLYRLIFCLAAACEHTHYRLGGSHAPAFFSIFVGMAYAILAITLNLGWRWFLVGIVPWSVFWSWILSRLLA